MGDKALLSVGLVVTALVTPPVPGGMLAAVVAVAVLLGPARVPGRVLAEAMAGPCLFIVLGAISVAVVVTVPGAAGAGTPTSALWWSWGPLSMTGQSLVRGAELAVHGVAGTLAVMVLATTTPMVDLVAVGRRLRIPDACLDIAALMYRLVFVLLDTTATVRAAQQARLGDARSRRVVGSRWSRSWVGSRVEAAGEVTGTVLVRSWVRASRLADGLAGRGYEVTLVTLPATQVRSWRFELATVAGVAAIWVTVWGVHAVGTGLM
ncbi:Cobalt transport protein CbiQ [Austwickia sp. TVS 96-490-7B]|nr:Cobalt transport protein CbiQ [Austwickia sp. TVS 96-490-7B]